VYQTIAALSEVVASRLVTETEAEAKDLVTTGGKEKAMVALRKEGSYPPFFAIPGFLLYRHLVSHMSENQPFYGFEIPPYEELEEVVQHFIHEMKQVQPHGPYFLGAFCGDYPIIFEVAHQLLAQGEQVPVVALFEAYSPQGHLSKKSFKYINQKIGIYFDEMRKKTIAEQLKFIADEVSIKFNFIYKRLTGANKNNYVLKAYPGKVVLFKASVITPGTVDDPLGGWSEHVTGEIEVLTTTGDHITIFKEPGVQELASKLDAVLAKSRK
jgi:thioesterase domain-containing protein